MSQELLDIYVEMANNLSKQEILDLSGAFSICDKEGDGAISTEELGNVLKFLNQNPSEAELEKMINEIDPNGEGNLDFSGLL